jgi:Protein CHAPERONE-LIKE PROTEIN OF POR1-like
MSDQNPYEKLGVSEEASFEEVQDVRNRLVEQYSGDTKRLEVIEAAYDAILMDRLRMRQEGKIKVPERIRFPERLMQAAPKESSTPKDQSRAWLQKFIDQPTATDIIVPGACYLGLSAISLFYQVGSSDQILQLALVFGVGSSIYFLNRKENKFGRAVLLTLLGLVVGLITGGLVSSLIVRQITFISLSSNQFSSVLTFILLWLINSFIR